MFSFDLFSHITQGKILVNNSAARIEHFLTDSRKIFNPGASVFVAIKGERNDGHDYLGLLFAKGVRMFIVENESSIPAILLKNSSILVVHNSIEALQLIAAFHRQQFEYPVIGVTGSNGKTIIKEWLGQLLEKTFKIVKSPKSYNSQLGVPLSVLQMNAQHTLAIFEAGISTVGEMAKLRKVIDPNIGIFANLGSAHDEGFKDRTEKAMEKWQLFHGCSSVIFCADHAQVYQTKPVHIHALTWGKDALADIRINSVVTHGNQSTLELYL